MKVETTIGTALMASGIASSVALMPQQWTQQLFSRAKSLRGPLDGKCFGHEPMVKATSQRNLLGLTLAARSVTELGLESPSDFFKQFDQLGLPADERRSIAESLLDAHAHDFVQIVEALGADTKDRHRYAHRIARQVPELVARYHQRFHLEKMDYSQQSDLIENAFFGRIDIKEFGNKCWISRGISLEKLQQFLSIAGICRVACKLADGGQQLEIFKHSRTVDLIQQVVGLEKSGQRKRVFKYLERFFLMQNPFVQRDFLHRTEDLSRHGLINALLVHQAIFNTDCSDEVVKPIFKVFGSKSFKNAQKLSRANRFLDELLRLNLSTAENVCILKAVDPYALPDAPVSDQVPSIAPNRHVATDQLLKNITLMQVALRLKAMGMLPEYVDFTDVSNPRALNLFVKQLAFHVLGIEANDANRAAVERYFEHYEDPSLLLIWAARQIEYEAINPEQSTINRAWVKKISEWILHEREHARYGELAHLIPFKQADAEAYSKWTAHTPPEALSVPTEEVADILGERVDNTISKDGDRWVAKVTGTLDDLLMCGTRVPWSCQHVSHHAKDNQGLIGYVLQAKMVGLWKEGRLFGRVMLLLGKDMETKHHVLYMVEKVYGQPECNELHHEVLQITAKRYADWIGLELIDAAEMFQPRRTIAILNEAPLYCEGVGIRHESYTITFGGGYSNLF